MATGESKEKSPTNESSRLTNILQGLFIISLGGAFSFAGFRFGLKQQIEKAKHEFEDRKPVDIDPNKAGPSGIPAKQLAMKAFARGSAAAFIVAALGGFGLSFIVEAKHKGISREQEQGEMRELYKELGILEDMEKEEDEVPSSPNKD
jgi:hypothetical protein